MKLITIRTQIEEVSKRWDSQYPYPQRDGSKSDIAVRLREIDLKTASADDVAAIIGNKSWAGPQTCDECEGSFDEVVQVGQPPDYDSATVHICVGCAAKALSLFGK